MRGAHYKRYVLAVLLVVLTFTYLERSVLAMGAQSIKSDLELSDTQLGLLSGIAFTFFYSIAGVPLARAADRGRRVTVISITTALASIAIALCGFAASFAQLLLIRVGVAVGEAGCIPPAHSLIAHHFDRAERPRAIGIYSLGGPLSIFIGYFLAGWLIELQGWRHAFAILGLPGVLLAVFVWLTLREPAAAGGGPDHGARDGAPWQVSSQLWRNRSYRHLLVCFSLLFFFGQGIWQWLPVFFVRSFGMQTGTLGTWLSFIVGLTGIVGTLLGGELASRFAARDERTQLRGMALAYTAYGVLSIGMYLAANPYLAFTLLGMSSLGGAMANGPLFASVQSVVPPEMRARAIALIYLFANLIGLGLGPLAVGALSDAFHPWAAAESLRYALLVLCPGYFWAAWHLVRASATVSHDMSQVSQPDEMQA